MKYLRTLLVLAAVVMFSAASAHAQLNITPTFDSSITNLSNAAAIEAAINAAIAQTESSITTYHLDNVSISFVYDPTTDLGANSSVVGNISLAKYVADLNANPTKSALQTAAIATMPTGPLPALNNNTTMTLTASNLMAIGETSLANSLIASNGGFNGTVYLNLGIMNVSRTSGQVTGKYDLQAVTQHEMDEVLGVGGYATTIDGSGPLPNTLGSMDLFRYSAAGTRSFTGNKNAVSYFSVDNGNTVLVHFLQTGDGDYADFGTGVVGQDKGNTPPNVQDAFATPFGSGPIPNLGVNELTAFQVVGYNLFNQASYWLGANSGAWTGAGNWAINAKLTREVPPSARISPVHSITVSDATDVAINSGSGGPYTLTVSGAGINVQAGAGQLTVNAIGSGSLSGTLDLFGKIRPSMAWRPPARAPAIASPPPMGRPS